jgi:23S rRNA-/tRNA-specific pseudouridylate synthase
MLHAAHLAFAHPRTGARLELTREAPFAPPG